MTDALLTQFLECVTATVSLRSRFPVDGCLSIIFVSLRNGSQFRIPLIEKLDLSWVFAMLAQAFIYTLEMFACCR